MGYIHNFEDAYKTLELSTVDREFTNEEINTLDIDKDGTITSFDAYLILSYSILYISFFPHCYK